MGEELGVSNVTIFNDVKYLRTEYAKSRERLGEHLETALQDLDEIQRKAHDVLATVTGTDQLAVLDRLLKTIDQRCRLLGLYPKPGSAETEEFPTGPIEVRITVIPEGNRKIIDPELNPEDDGFDDDDEVYEAESTFTSKRKALTA
jgi:hypothetical protein